MVHLNVNALGVMTARQWLTLKCTIEDSFNIL